MENGNHDVHLFDGTNDFFVWRSRIENELMRSHLLGYVVVQDYNGSQSFIYRGEHVPVKCQNGLSKLDAMKGAAEAMHIVQWSLHEKIALTIVNKNVYDSWATLNALYGSAKNHPTVFEMLQMLSHMWYGEKGGESMEEFSLRWGVMVQQLAQVTGDLRSDSLRSALFQRALPRSCRPSIAKWRDKRPWIPFKELVEKAITEAKRIDQIKSTGARGARNTHEPSATKAMQEMKSCFYCFKTNHSFSQCNYLLHDIETGRTHKESSSYSCIVTDQRTRVMVEALEKFIAEVTTRNSSTEMQGSRKRGREIDSREFDRRSKSRPPPPHDFDRRSKSRPPPPCSNPHRSQSAHPSTTKRSPPHGGRLRSVFRSEDCAEAPCYVQSFDSNFEPFSKFWFPQRKRSPSFERELRSS